MINEPPTHKVAARRIVLALATSMAVVAAMSLVYAKVPEPK